jgi:hypothetical protein
MDTGVSEHCDHTEERVEKLLDALLESGVHRSLKRERSKNQGTKNIEDKVDVKIEDDMEAMVDEKMVLLLQETTESKSKATRNRVRKTGRMWSSAAKVAHVADADVGSTSAGSWEPLSSDLDFVWEN